MSKERHSIRVLKCVSTLFAPAITLGWGIGGLLGAAFACGLFWLVNAYVVGFDRTPVLSP